MIECIRIRVSLQCTPSSVFLRQVMWVCNLCRKQQEILTKSGEWFSPGPRRRPLSLGAPVAVPEADVDRKLRSRSQVPTVTNCTAADTQAPATGPADRAKGADTMPASRARSEPPREKYACLWR